MMHLRTAGLAALFAFLALAAFGSATASATRLCSTEAEICPEAKRWGPTIPLTGEVSAPLQIVTGNGNMNCKKSKIEGEIVNFGGISGVSVAAEIASISFAECSLGGTACTTATDLGAPYAVEFIWKSLLNGTMKISPGWEFICGAKLNCIYSAPNTKLTVTGAVAAEVGASGLTLSRQGPNCTGTATLNAIYILSSPGPMYVTDK
jgi:hypothetical protein